MKRFFPLRMAVRETRGSRGRLALYMVAITAGVASLVAIGSFRTNVTDSVRDQARTVLGADLAIRHRSEFPDTITALVSKAALGDPTRLKLLLALGEAELCVCDLAAAAGASPSGVSHHLRLLRALRLVRSRRDGRMIYYRLDDEHVGDLLRTALAHQEH